MQIHQFENNGYKIILDVPSGSVHVADDLIYDTVRAAALYFGAADPGTIPDLPVPEEKSVPEEACVLKVKDRDGLVHCLPFSVLQNALGSRWTDEELLEAAGEMQELADAGSLFFDRDYRPSIESFANRKTVVKALCLHVAHDCNLRCRYCFADEGEYHGKREIMPYEVGREALDFLVAQSGSRKNLEVDFFGGEPLMNFETVKKLVAYGRSIEKEHGKNFRFTLTTNGVLLNDEFTEFANRELSNVVLSLDGRKEVHDAMRPFPNGKGSYDTVLPKYAAFVKARGGKKYYLRGTFTNHNLDFATDVLQLADLGFTELSMEPVVAPDSAEYAILPEDVPVICEEYDRLAKEMLVRKNEGNAFQFFHFMIDLSGGPCVYKRLSGCGSGTEYLAVTPSGDLYPCHQFVGQEEFRLGNVRTGIEREDIVSRFRMVNVYAKEECRSCFARFYCSGGCAANAWNFTGDLCGNYKTGCDLERKRVECALMLKAAGH